MKFTITLECDASMLGAFLSAGLIGANKVSVEPLEGRMMHTKIRDTVEKAVKCAVQHAQSDTLNLEMIFLGDARPFDAASLARAFPTE